MTPRAELIYDSHCPNIQAARAALEHAFSRIGLPATGTEWERKAIGSPSYVNAFGSPTILVNGENVAGIQPGEKADSCRVYIDERGDLRGVPSVEHIVSALSMLTASKAERQKSPSFYWRNVGAVLPGIGASLLPVGLCPACWPAYAGVLSSLGVGFLVDTQYLLPLTIAFLILALFSLATSRASRLGYLPLFVGTIAAAFILSGKFVFSSNPLLYLGVAALLGASIWNSLPLQAANTGSCEKCAPRSR